MSSRTIEYGNYHIIPVRNYRFYQKHDLKKKDNISISSHKIG